MCLRMGSLRESFAEGGDGGVVLEARWQPDKKPFWCISSSDEQADIFLNPELLTSVSQGAKVDLRIFFDAATFGYEIARTNERRSIHLFIWNRGTFAPRILCPNDMAGSLGLVLPPNTQTIVSGHGDGVLIEIDWVRLRLRLGADDETHISRPWSVDREYFSHELPPDFGRHPAVPTCIQGVDSGFHKVGRNTLHRLIISHPRSPRVFIFKHLKMMRPDERPHCTAQKLRLLGPHINIVQYDDWCPISRLLARAYLHGGAITYENFRSHKDVMPLAYDMIMALDYLHANDIVHANVKRTNIFLVNTPGTKPVFKLADFALTAEDDSILLRKKEDYTAPEVFAANGKGKAIDKVYQPKSDVWALGIVLLEMLFKDPPRNWHSPRGCYTDAVESKKRRVADTVPQELAELLDGMLQPRPQTRKTALELADSLPERPDV
ncbi:kinase-like protein [Coniochaeta ligniaria NRRL 30616]|uniref:non-specific serine/threonine protein kinase n=1 Tax=Coniochaeta ligniaria NRRL 30616 TaxID=1408157 RepID=A0A1J7I5J8_9PEZI|nr:kinase-like protein [Coniochaeta ligniaria NRRL 30616]